MPRDSSLGQAVLLPNAPIVLRYGRSAIRARFSTNHQASENTFEPSLDRVLDVSIYQPNGQNGKPGRPSGTSSLREEFEFISTSSSGGHREDHVQSLVRSKARRWAYHKKRLAQSDDQDRKCDLTSNDRERLGTTALPKIPAMFDEAIRQFLKSPERLMSIYGPLPYKFDQEWHRLAEVYIYVMAPATYRLERYLTYNPAAKFWFPASIQDETVILAMLWSVSVFISKIRGMNEIFQAGPIFQRLLSRLRVELASPERPSQSTVLSVGLLATMTRWAGRYDDWSIHRRGFIDALQSRGGMESLDSGTHALCYLAEIGGAIDFFEPPLLKPPSGPPLVVERVNNDCIEVFVGQINSSVQSLELRGKLLKLKRFNEMTRSAIKSKSKLHPYNWDWELYSIIHDLLVIPRSDLSTMESALLVAGIIYGKAIRVGVPFNPWMPMPLLNSLYTSMQEIQDKYCEYTKQLTTWLYAVGAIGVVPSYMHKDWFIQSLVQQEVGLTESEETFHRVESVLVSAMWIPEVHGKALRRCWDECLSRAHNGHASEGRSTNST